MSTPEGTISPEVKVEPVVSFEGAEVRALAVFLHECRDLSRSGPAYYLLVDMHNKAREALGLEPVPVNPSWQAEYKAFKADPNALSIFEQD